MSKLLYLFLFSMFVSMFYFTFYFFRCLYRLLPFFPTCFLYRLFFRLLPFLIFSSLSQLAGMWTRENLLCIIIRPLDFDVGYIPDWRMLDYGHLNF
jgi:hypothetical protein